MFDPCPHCLWALSIQPIIHLLRLLAVYILCKTLTNRGQILKEGNWLHISHAHAFEKGSNRRAHHQEERGESSTRASALTRTGLDDRSEGPRDATVHGCIWAGLAPAHSALGWAGLGLGLRENPRWERRAGWGGRAHGRWGHWHRQVATSHMSPGALSGTHVGRQLASGDERLHRCVCQADLRWLPADLHFTLLRARQAVLHLDARARCSADC
mmetsp:Transcript_1098/g.3011  ORF Transcript_1098/g.3011 Transcript_1098/m.3011 type:complete len:213 (-) Transcript_1098:1984-2622(-)